MSETSISALDELKRLRLVYRELELQVKNLRDQLDRGEASRYVSLSYTELESSRHWLGEAMGALGAENPYKE